MVGERPAAAGPVRTALSCCASYLFRWDVTPDFCTVRLFFGQYVQMDVPQCALSSLTETPSASSRRPSRPPSPAVDRSTPIGRAVAGFYLAFEAVDDSDRLREAANSVGSRQTPESDSRDKYLALATAITNVEKFGVMRRARCVISPPPLRTRPLASQTAGQACPPTSMTRSTQQYATRASRSASVPWE